ncbi:hypothetical protein BLA60_30760 [Actinophytocola xinjiangensis]|uniref:Putative T7SS secretion signal domain-containing protein n=1 Tax=Actinophytocola xinjiangensis TaxID=485602 RepID=A0A7Z0WJJ8_9PSEU|nr:hypothetical protein [Actinophytocola xinjiangensis]OLF06649.1 hypothetical protein BLA60_30760 [Actinophytocola xinjiangensis]
MAAELGETTDRTALVPGSPETVHGAASTLTTRGATLEAIGEAIGRVDTPGWFGEACSAFWDTFGQEKANWFTAADALTSAGTTLTGYAETLSWAQDQAQEAIDLWEQGEAATATARTSYNETLAEYRSMGLPDTELAPFDDPGTAKRTEAQTILTEARTTLVEAGDSAAAALRAGAGGEAGAPEWLATASQVAQDAIDEFGLSVTQDSWDIGDDGPVGDDDMRQWGDDTGDDDDQNKGPNWSVALWEAGADVALWEANAEGEIQLGDATLSGSAGVQFLSAEAGAEFSIGSDGLTMGANAGAYLLQANAEGSIQYGILEAGASGEVMVGAEASGDLSIGADGLHAGGEAFAGAKAEGTLSGDVGGVGGAITGEAWAGVGVAADLDIGMEDGKFVIGGELGAAIGVGGSISPEITIDPGEVVDTVSDAADAVGDIAGDVGDWAGDTFGGLF